MKDGEGIEEWEDGSRFDGGFKQGRKHGYGVFVWADGSRYAGNFKEDIRHGHGSYRTVEGEMVHGEWKKGRFLGSSFLGAERQISGQSSAATVDVTSAATCLAIWTQIAT